jgi:hypothetical protein
MERSCTPGFLSIPACLLLASAIPAQETLSDREGVEFFEKRIRPVLRERCQACHGDRAGEAKGGLRLDSRAALLRGGDSGPAVVPGDPERSRLIAAIRYLDADLRMPPKVKFRLSASEVADFEHWVRKGAPDPREDGATAPSRNGPDLAAARRFWSFQALAEPPLPAVGAKDWPRNSVDHFILARLEERGLRPVADADRRRLIRRATFDLTGLPPEPEEIDDFLADGSSGAFSRVVDRLLASPRYGERWGRHWLDLVRYADTAGDNSDFPIPPAYRYRDYVIRSFNEDKPYARFLREQVAGDLLPAGGPEERRDQIVATGFIALARRFGTLVIDYNPHQIIEDTLDTLGRSVLGLTLGCARCHDHKFDPVTQEDYYALYGIFESTRYPFPGLEEVKIPRDFHPLLPPEEVEAILKPFQARLAPLEAEVKRLEEEKSLLLRKAAEGGVEASEAARRLKDVEQRIGQAKRKRDDVARDPPPVEVAYAVAEGEKTGNARVQVRGDPGNLGAEVPRRFLAVLGGNPLPADEKGSGRLQLADWLTDPANPLTPRVMVNRIWQHHFGRGLVGTPSDFGTRGQPPTHPELLDHLARRFLESGGSVKAMHRLLMLSRTYQLSSRDDAAAAAADPGNELRWRFGRRRLDAEEIRDAMLRVAGALDLRMGGPHPFPPQRTWEFSQHRPFVAVYDGPRRSVYLMTQRFRRHPFFAIFDGPDTNATTPQRSVSVTALQALFMMNDPFVREQAGRFAARVLAAGQSEQDRIERAYLLAFGRPPSEEDRRAGERFLRQAGNGSPDAWTRYAQALLSLNEFITLD